MNQNRFYVYRLVDPRDDSVFYVGKGQGSRMYAHEKEVLNGRATHNARKIERIVAIHACGARVRHEKVRDGLLEAEAMALECELIAATLGLTNMTPGGDGWAISEAAWKQREKARNAALFEKNKPKIIGGMLRRILWALQNPVARMNVWHAAAMELVVEVAVPLPPARDDVDGRLQAFIGVLDRFADGEFA